MKKIWLVARKDLQVAYSGPFIYIIYGLFSLVSGWLFFNILVSYVDRLQATGMVDQSRINFMQEVVFSLFGNLHFMLLFFVPALTMRLIAEEKKQSTLELLYLSPLSEWDIISGKILAGVLLLAGLLSVTLTYPVILLGAGVDDLPLLGMNYLGLLLVGSCYVSFGVLASSLTDQQMVASVISFVGLILFWMLNWMAQSVGGYFLHEIFSYLAIGNHFEKWVRGSFETQTVVYFVSFVFIMMYLSVKNLQRRLW